MTETILDIKQWGNNLGVRLPAAKQLLKKRICINIKGGRISVEDEKVIITPLRDQALTLEERLARFDPERHGGEAMTAKEILGAERW